LKKPFALLLVFSALGITAYALWQNRFGVPEEFAAEDHFKYGSIGSDNLTGGLPYWIWKVLPEMFPQYLPANDKRGYEAFGLIAEPGKDRPIGFSKRTIWKSLVFVGPNCALCHVSTLRRTADQPPEIILGMPANTFDIEKFFQFLFRSAADPDFTGGNVMNHIEKINPQMGYMEKMVYRWVIFYIYRWKVLRLAEQYDFLEKMPEFGPGRVDTWTPYKRTIVVPNLPVSVAGIADFPSIWNQRLRTQHKLHWDGNNHLLEERNIIAALGVVGTDFESLDLPRLRLIGQWIMALRPPRYEEKIPENKEEFRIKRDLAETGRGIYRKHCASCHASEGERLGRVEPVATLGTDPNRVDGFTEELASALNKIGTDSWALRNFKKTEGYVNSLLDGIWLRAPYLHNGSVPTLRDLLKKPDQRPKKFYRGNDVYDWSNVGFKADVAEEQGRKFFEYDTTKTGNRNGGHLYGTELLDDEKNALIEYLKTL